MMPATPTCAGQGVPTSACAGGSPVSRKEGHEQPTAEQMGAEAVIRVDVDYESIQIGQGRNMFMVSASGTRGKL